MRKIISVLLSMLLVTAGSVPVFAVDEKSENFDIKIVHTNDIHARVQEDASSGIIGMPKLKTLIDNYTADSDMKLVLDSGDLYHGQSFATLVKGVSVAQLVQACGYDAMTAGNHDWNYGKDQLKNLETISGCTVLTGNVVDTNGASFFDQEYLIKSVEKNGTELKIGIFGMIDPQIYSSTAPSNVEGLEFTDMTAYAQEAVADLENMDCDIIIALVHAIDPVDLAEGVDGVDLWLAGHEHQDIDTVVTTPDGSESRVIENAYYLYEAGLIEIECSVDGSGNIENLDITASKAAYDDVKDLEGDTAVQALIDQIKADEDIELTKVVGSTPEDLDGVWEHLRIGETNLGRVITDAYLLETDADVAFENAGGIRASVSKGDVTYGDIIGIAPFGNYIVTKQITGAELLEVLETALSIQVDCIAANNSGDYDAWPVHSGEYLQVGGMTVKYDLSKEEGNRIWYAEVQGEPLVKDKLYTVASNNFLVISAVYPQLAAAGEVGQYSACDEALIKYFEQSEDMILKSVTTAHMIEEPYTEPSSSDEPQESSDIQESSGSSSDVSVPTDEPSTGDSTVPMTMVVIMFIGTAAVSLFCVAKTKKKLKK